MATLVRFLIEKDNSNDVFAFFPQLNHNKRIYGNDVKTCYAHVGQHSSCSFDYANECIEATKEAYTDLLNELKGQGYDNLRILNTSK